MSARALVLVLALLSGCADATDQPAPWHLPAFDGEIATSERERPPAGELEPAPVLDARALFDLVLTCYPTRSWWRPELALQGRVQDRRRADSSNEIATAESGTHVALVLRVPLYSAAELDRERERERLRRGEVAAAIGALEKLLADRTVVRRELDLWRAIENRSGRRVVAGVAATDEQINAITQVAARENRLRQIAADLTAQTLVLVGQCVDRADVERVIARVIEARP